MDDRDYGTIIEAFPPMPDPDPGIPEAMEATPISNEPSQFEKNNEAFIPLPYDVRTDIEKANEQSMRKGRFGLVAVLVALALIVILTFSFFGSLAPLVSRLFSPNSVELENQQADDQQADDLETDDLETDDLERGNLDHYDLLSQYFTKEMLSSMPRVEGALCESDGFVLQVVAAARTDDKAMIILTVEDNEQRGLFVNRDLYTLNLFAFQVASDNGRPVAESFLDYSDPNTGVLVLHLIGLTLDKTISLELDGLAKCDWVDQHYAYESLSYGTWSFSFRAGRQQERAFSCNLDAIGASFHNIYDKYPTKVTEVSIAPFCMTIIAGGILWMDNDIDLIMDDGDRAKMCRCADSGDFMLEDGPRICGLTSGRGYSRDIGGNYEHILLIHSDSDSQLKGTLLEVDRIIAIEINGVRQDF